MSVEWPSTGPVSNFEEKIPPDFEKELRKMEEISKEKKKSGFDFILKLSPDELEKVSTALNFIGEEFSSLPLSEDEKAAIAALNRVIAAADKIEIRRIANNDLRPAL